MRIIAGSAGGIPIKVPPAVTRPTTDRVRQAVFSMLGEFVAGARVLDLFAGSGALGLEALSRGAASALFVDSDARVCVTIRENLEKTRLGGGTIRKGEAIATLRFLAEAGHAFDLIFADPPYAHHEGDIDWAGKLLANPDLRRVLAGEGQFVLECRMTKEGKSSWSGWRVDRDRAYGNTRVLCLSKSGDEPSTKPDSL